MKRTILLTLALMLLNAIWSFNVLAVDDEMLTVFAQNQAHDLDDGWQMQSTILVDDDARIISSHGFEPQNWHPTKPGWTVLNTLIKDGVYPHMYFGMNNYLIPDMSDAFNEQYDLARFSHLSGKQNPWTSPWWFRKTFSLESVATKTTWLEMDCINYRAEIWVNGRMVAGSKQIVGFFERFRFDVSDFVKQGENALAVKIFPPDHPGVPEAQVEPVGHDRQWVNSDLMRDMTMIMTIGYDSFPTVRDRNMGILQDVRIRQTGAVTIRHPFVKTEMRLPKTDQATIMVSAELINATDTPQKAVLRGKIEGTDLAFEQAITLNPKETRMVKIKPFFMQKPKLWFPHGHGEQNLYTISLEAVDETETVSDSLNARFGVRQITTELHKYNDAHGRRILINGKKIFARGGYFQPDALLDWDRERIETELRYYREAGVNFIHTEDIPNPPEWFLDLCDEYGFMFGNCYFVGFWVRPDSDYPDEKNLLEPAAIDLTKRYRNHPSLIFYMSVGEGPVREEVYSMWRHVILEHDGTRFWIPTPGYADRDYENCPDWIRQDMPTGMTGAGHWGWWPVDEYFRKVHEEMRWIFNMESGSASIPPIESLRLFLPDIDSKTRVVSEKRGDIGLFPQGVPWFNIPDGIVTEKRGTIDLFPLDVAWAEHDYSQYHLPYHVALYRLFNAPSDVADYCRKSHVLTADQHRAMFEAMQHRMWDITSGFGQWKLNSAWPSVSWQIFDWFHRPMVNYYFIKRANRPVHVLWSPLDNQVYVVNHKMEMFRGTVHADVYDFNMKKLFSAKQLVNISHETSSEIGLEILRFKDVPEGVYFLKLRLVDIDNSFVSDNFYWIPTHESLAGLEKLTAVALEYSVAFRTEGEETVGMVTVKNPTDQLAFFVRAILDKEMDGEEVLPVFWNDNYINLLPGESQILEVRVKTKHLSGQKPVVRFHGWK